MTKRRSRSLRPWVACSKRPAELIGCTIATARWPPGTSTRAASEIAVGRSSTSSHRHERDGQVGDAGSEREARDIAVHDAPAPSAIGASKATGTLDLDDRVTLRSQRTSHAPSPAPTPTPTPRSTVSRPGGGSSAKNRSP